MIGVAVQHPAPRPDVRLVLALAAVYLIWSSTYLAIKVAIVDLPPLLVASVRFVAAGLVLLIVARRRGAALPPLRDWLRVLPIGVLFFLGGNGLVSIAQQSVTSGGAALVCAMMPLWVGVLGAATGDRPTRREWLSLALGFVGIVVLMGGPSLAGEPHHVVMIVCAPICWALGSVLARRLPARLAGHTFLVPAMQMLGGGAALAVAGVLAGERMPLDAHATSWLAVGYLWLFGSLIGFTAYAWLLRHARPAVATSYAYVNPVLAVLLGAALTGEPLGWTTLVANLLIVAAVGLALARRRGTRREAVKITGNSR